METLFTVGHSNRSMSEFIDVLRPADIHMLVDIRRFPASRRHPHFSIRPLRDALTAAGVAYRHVPELGGYREPRGVQSASPNNGWPPGFLRNYADYAMTDAFQAALNRVRRTCGPRPALMCAERRWTDCHRRIVADYVIVGGHRVVHLIDAVTREDGWLTSFAKCMVDGRILYHTPLGQLELDF